MVAGLYDYDLGYVRENHAKSYTWVGAGSSASGGTSGKTGCRAKGLSHWPGPLLLKERQPSLVPSVFPSFARLCLQNVTWTSQEQSRHSGLLSTTAWGKNQCYISINLEHYKWWEAFNSIFRSDQNMNFCRALDAVSSVVSETSMQPLPTLSIRKC